jgi:phosphomannomutase/phosphoglucomutase
VKKSGGSVRQYDIVTPYLKTLKEKIKLARPLKVVVDCGNGTTSLFAEELFSSLGCQVIPLYCESDPSFPNHHPDPVVPENLKDLILEVKKQKADLGLSFDGDGDRLGAVDETGQIIWGDQMMILFWREILPKHPGAEAIVEVKCSQALPEEIERLGGKPFFYRTGHSLIKAKMREIGAIFTGEMSGHMFFADEYYGYDDALYAAGRLLRLISQQDKTLSQLLADVPKYHATPELRVDCADKDKFRVVSGITKSFAKKYPVIDVDGARVLFPDGWGLVRASNTSPKLVVRCESGTPEGLSRIKNELSAALSQYPAIGTIQL